MDHMLSPTGIATVSKQRQATNGSVDDKKDETSSSLAHAMLSPDGTSIISSLRFGQTHCSRVESIILPPDLLGGTMQDIKPYSTEDLPEPVRAMAVYPFYDLSDPATTLALVAIPDHPARLVNALALQSGIVASYPYVRPETEETVAAHSLLFTQDGTQFLAGSDSELCIFDVNRPGQEALQRYRLRKDGRLGQRGQWRMKRGIISSLAVSNDEVLAVGTFGREVGLFDSNGQGGLVASFDLGDDIKGSGVSQLSWSACGRYLLISERKSDSIQVFDIRGQQKLLQTLTGRIADTMMKLRWDMTPNNEVWGGGMDGVVRVWEHIGMSEGSINSSGSWQAHQNPVISTMVHGSGAVVITAAAPDRNIIRQAQALDSGSSSDKDSDNDSYQASIEEDNRAIDMPMAIWQLTAPGLAESNNKAHTKEHSEHTLRTPSTGTSIPMR